MFKKNKVNNNLDYLIPIRKVEFLLTILLLVNPILFAYYVFMYLIKAKLLEKLNLFKISVFSCVYQLFITQHLILNIFLYICIFFIVLYKC